MAHLTYYPAFLNLNGKRVLLFGAGKVALRKAHVLVQSGAKLLAISHDFSTEFLRFAKQKQIRIQSGSAFPKSLKRISLVVAATSDEVFNRKVYRRCLKENILVNVVDDPKHSTFIVPSILRRGALQIAISTGGASPFLAKMLRKKLESQFGASYGKLVRELSCERRQAKRLIKLESTRRNHFQKLVRSRLKLVENQSLRGR
ncbi:MAG: bifunctional precorrin-2 dehydrogenase/sirohydrochlorin ferrochelatase [Candidatus Omnitrophica bacterium]|nr:bifunctional precorrin-2 dehydrogenase/sirohydrochlorin ferrochelatase [Candidatus Omnitrophota bacterium]